MTSLRTMEAMRDRDQLLDALEDMLKTEPNKAIRTAAQRLYIELTEPRKEAA